MIVLADWLDTLLLRFSKRYRVTRFYKICRLLYVHGDHGWNNAVRALLAKNMRLNDDGENLF